jgi:hypothetical protein
MSLPPQNLNLNLNPLLLLVSKNPPPAHSQP